MNEFEIIARYFAPLSAAAPGAAGLKDDAATFAVPPGREVAVTVDTLIEGGHFLADDPAPGLAEKCLAVNLSDLAATGAEPMAYLLSMALPAAWPGAARTDWLEGFARGLARAQRHYAVSLIGGDTVQTPGPLAVTVTALGTVAAGRALRRSGARPGDIVCVSGTIGDGALGLMALQGRLAGVDAAGRAALIARYRAPEARVALGRALVGLATAAADISDGLIADLGHICAASRVAATIQSLRVPLSAPARAALDADQGRLATVLGGGDDYELVFTVPADKENRLAPIAAASATPVTAIGTIGQAASSSQDAPVTVIGSGGRKVAIAHLGHRHF